MWTTLNALGPVFLVIVLGIVLKRLAFPAASFWPELERLIYYFLFPAMLVARLSQANLSEVPVAPVMATVVLTLVLMSALIILTRPWLASTAASFTSVYQGGMRFNTYVGLAVVAQLYGDAEIALAAVIIAVMIPLLNVFCVLIFAFYTGDDKPSLGPTLKALSRNPLIVSCFIGIALNVMGIGLPGWSAPFAEMIARTALPLGLMAVGVGLNLMALREAHWPLLCACLLKLIVMPLVAALIATWLGLAVDQRAVVLLFMALPTASSAYILARQLGGDTDLMAAIITAQTLLAMVTLPLMLGVSYWWWG
ncbi:hypothetical protein BFW38_15310 [Terasakiispira papahanaumokuakeensis]|uniref:Transporter n=1 Tax=Terasakiispira papahanaumokuakeensis TaxID=197479 RepID=A0A1E2VCW3_9GAMM|nr:AEC family transporter [Terasakiispira papahanaumokuakeensis]ODC04692.1 hypothetical protein BFW38_15310 [Terasakiispira papahanaumokuakeensis]